MKGFVVFLLIIFGPAGWFILLIWYILKDVNRSAIDRQFEYQKRENEYFRDSDFN